MGNRLTGYRMSPFPMWVGIPIAPIPESSIEPSRTPDPIPGFPLNIRLPQIPDLSILSPRTHPTQPSTPNASARIPSAPTIPSVSQLSSSMATQPAIAPQPSSPARYL